MKISGIITIAALVPLLSNRAWAQSPDAAAILARDAAIDAHLVKAREAAGFDFTGTLAHLCVYWSRFGLRRREKATARMLLSIGSTLRAAWSADDFAFFSAVENVNGDYLPRGSIYGGCARRCESRQQG
jgi:hypothetical protein